MCSWSVYYRSSRENAIREFTNPMKVTNDKRLYINRIKSKRRDSIMKTNFLPIDGLRAQ